MKKIIIAKKLHCKLFIINKIEIKINDYQYIII